ncbi:Major royal jelly protein [Catalinimonas alkaloidigena]|uniref:Major royal jelly protein n=1 Tax=Catalinimonas alkaloidigena TaxID=1075417 RepID=A0A1G8YI43_9BACT|nr:L-dopachrome tautomerase-related protein [Catalinimonas alkaloidigena]SDK02373.1 Major royal jelly protein [Catalinimonas alkaloidigena]
MKSPRFTHLLVVMALLWPLHGCQWIEDLYPPKPQPTPGAELIEVARSATQWTGVAVSTDERIFVNYPNWSPDHTISVAEVLDTTTVVAYPNEAWNTWDASLDPATHFVCVQAVWTDASGYLWVLDPANPQRNGKYLGVVPGGAKLVQIDLATGEVVQTYGFAAPAITPNSYLNDVRFDHDRQVAYITDSNEGAIVVLDLATGEARRLLANHYSTKSENLVFEIDGTVWRNPDGSLPSVQSDGIALDAAKEYLYYQALTGKTVYRIGTAWLRDPALSEAELAAKVENVDVLAAADGIIFGPEGALYLTDVPNKAVQRYTIGGHPVTWVQSDELEWPDTFSVGPDGYLYVTTSQIHIPNPTEPYRLFKIKLP